MGELHPPIQITDENDNPLRGGTMDEAQLLGLWHRIAGVMVWDPREHLYLLQQIAPNPYYNGGKWNLTATGHVDEGESYDEAAARELFEEMGVRGLSLVIQSHYSYTKQAHRAGKMRTYKRHYTVFTTKVNSSTLIFKPNPEEVEKTMWAHESELLKMYNSKEPAMTDTLLRFVREELVGGN